MTDHAHAWNPVPGEVARYRFSACHALGWRRPTGEIREYATKPWRTEQTTAQPVGDGNGAVPARDPKIGWER